MASPEERRRQIADSLERSIQLTAQLEELLLEEARAIQSRTPERLLALVADKKTLVVELEQETQRQKGWIEDAGYAFDPPGVAHCFAQLDPDEGLINRWVALRGQVARCNALNQENASLIDRDRKRIAMSMQILRGEDDHPTTYNPYGRAESVEPRSRSLSRA